ncbi:MAG: DUF2635 domain-containing protein [Planctomycetaceae bacterium]|nr:DUF2635 domain-containing protein [Planctomycetaceae bacterium]
MIKQIRIKPAPGRRVIDPVTDKALGPEAVTVSDNALWRRRLRDGDVFLADAEPTIEPAAAARAKAK